MNLKNLQENLKKLRLTAINLEFQEAARHAEKAQLTYEQFLAHLVESECTYRDERRVERLQIQSKAPAGKTLEEYDCSRVKGVSSPVLKRLASGDWVRNGENLVLYGSFGVGKTHIAIGLIKALCQQGLRCFFTSAQQLLEELQIAEEKLCLSQTFKKYDRFDLLVCDELGYVPTTEKAADLFFQLIAHRYERKSILITTNLQYSEWDKVFIKKTTTSAVVDRVIHHCETISIQGKSKRMEDAEVKAAKKNKLTS